MIKINSLEIENVKRVKAVHMTPGEAGLTVIGGNNGQGKTSVLDAIAWALGGDKFKPSNAARAGSVTDPYLRIELSNGLIVERKGKNSALKVISADGEKGGQQLLNEFVSTFALDLPKFMNSSGKEKADLLLQIIGVGEQLTTIETNIARTYNQRTEISRIADQKQKYADELIGYPEAPHEQISASDLIKTQQAILTKNGENQKQRLNLDELKRKQIATDEKITMLTKELQEQQTQAGILNMNIMFAEKTCETLQDESTTELEESLQNIEKINNKVLSNINKDRAAKDATDLADQAGNLTETINKLRAEKTALLTGAKLPLPDLSVDEGELIYKGQKWDGMSGADQLKVSTAIVKELSPECGFVLMDKLEQMDAGTLAAFGEYLEKENLQVIATRVTSNRDECAIIIEDGYIKDVAKIEPQKNWKEGEL